MRPYICKIAYACLIVPLTIFGFVHGIDYVFDGHFLARPYMPIIIVVPLVIASYVMHGRNKKGWSAVTSTLIGALFLGVLIGLFFFNWAFELPLLYKLVAAGAVLLPCIFCCLCASNPILSWFTLPECIVTYIGSLILAGSAVLVFLIASGSLSLLKTGNYWNLAIQLFLSGLLIGLGIMIKKASISQRYVMVTSGLAFLLGSLFMYKKVPSELSSIDIVTVAVYGVLLIVSSYLLNGQGKKGWLAITDSCATIVAIYFLSVVIASHLIVFELLFLRPWR